jgi:hypothetical protein
MSGYSDIDEAFPDTALQSGRIARKEERKRAKMCKGPALAFLKGGGEGTSWQEEESSLTDPDRQAHKRTATPRAMSGYDGFTSDQNSGNTKWIPKPTSINEEQEKELVANLVGQQVNDVIGLKSQKTFPKNLPNAAQLPDRKKDMFGKPVKSYFGKSLDDSFADFSSSLTDNPGYNLTQQTDFMGSFGAVGLSNSQGKPFSATPSVNDAWKPMTPSGARTSFFEYLPPPAGEYPTSSDAFNKDEKTALLKKLDTLFARLEDLESKRSENVHVEISLFVLSGLFLIYGMDSLRRI